MEGSNKHQYGNPLQRNLATLKMISRLLGHELHSQGGAKSITLSREEVLEVQTTIDLFIEDVGRRAGSQNSGTGSVDTQLVPARN